MRERRLLKLSDGLHGRRPGLHLGQHRREHYRAADKGRSGRAFGEK